MSVAPFPRRRVRPRIRSVALASLLLTSITLAVGAPTTAQALDPFPRDFASWHQVDLATPGARALDITTGLDGSIWYYDYPDHELVRVDPLTSVKTAFDLGGFVSIFDMAAARDGHIWYIDGTNNAISNLDPLTGAISSYPLTGFIGNPSSLALGTDGSLWFADTYAGELVRMSLTGVMTRYPVPSSPRLLNVVGAPDGRIWFSQGADQLGNYDPATGAFGATSLSFSGIYSVAVSRRGEIWAGGLNVFARIATDGTVTTIPVDASTGPGTHVRPDTMVAGEAVEIYFVDENRAIGRIDSSGSVTFVRPPFPGFQPKELTIDHFGSLWFTDFWGDSLGWV